MGNSVRRDATRLPLLLINWFQVQVLAGAPSLQALTQFRIPRHRPSSIESSNRHL